MSRSSQETRPLEINHTELHYFKEVPYGICDVLPNIMHEECSIFTLVDLKILLSCKSLHWIPLDHVTNHPLHVQCMCSAV